MNYLYKYFFITFFIFIAAYSVTFFVPITRTVKLAHNYFMLFYPLCVYAFMLRNYQDVKLKYSTKAAILASHVTFIVLLIILFGYWNPAEMRMNQKEAELGIVKVALTFGIILFLIGLIVAAFVKQRKPVT